MSFQKDASTEIAKAMEFRADTYTFCMRGQERMEDLVIKARRDEFLDMDKVKAFNRWAQAVHLMLISSLNPPQKLGKISRLLGRVDPPAEPGQIPYKLALAVASMVAHAYQQMIALSETKKVALELWDDEQKQVDGLIGRLKERKTEMYATATGGLPSFIKAREVIEQHNKQKDAIVNLLSAAGIDGSPARVVAENILTKLAEIQEGENIAPQGQERLSRHG